MANCNLEELSAQACSLGVVDLNERALLEIIATLLWNQAGQTPSLDVLNTQACAAGFVNLSEQKLLVVIAQLLCNMTPTPPVDCENLSGADSPLNVVSPEFVGQVYVQADGTIWQAGTVVSDSWTVICEAASCENLEGAASPLNVVTPDFVGQVYVQDDGTIWQAGTLVSDSWTVICEESSGGNGMVWGPNADTLDNFHYVDTDVFGEITEISFPGLVTVMNAIEVSESSITLLSFAVLETVGDNFIASGLNNLVTLEIPNLQSVDGDFNVSNNNSLPALSPISLTTVTGQLTTAGCNSLVTLSFPLLTDLTGGDANLGTMTLLETLSLPSLTIAAGLDFLNNPALTSIDFSVLGEANYLNFTSNSVLPSLSFPALTTLNGDITGADCTLLVSFSIPNLVIPDGSSIDLTNCALNATSVELILRRGIISGITFCTIDLSGGTSAGLASLSVQGQTDYADLITAGNTVTLNP